MGDDVKVIITTAMVNNSASAKYSRIPLSRCEFDWDDIPHEFQELIKEKIESQWREAFEGAESTK